MSNPSQDGETEREKMRQDGETEREKMRIAQEQMILQNSYIQKDVQSRQLELQKQHLDLEREKMESIERMKSQTLGVYQLTLAARVLISRKL